MNATKVWVCGGCGACWQLPPDEHPPRDELGQPVCDHCAAPPAGVDEIAALLEAHQLRPGMTAGRELTWACKSKSCPFVVLAETVRAPAAEAGHQAEVLARAAESPTGMPDRVSL